MMAICKAGQGLRKPWHQAKLWFPGSVQHAAERGSNLQPKRQHLLLKRLLPVQTEESCPKLPAAEEARPATEEKLPLKKAPAAGDSARQAAATKAAVGDAR